MSQAEIQELPIEASVADPPVADAPVAVEAPEPDAPVEPTEEAEVLQPDAPPEPPKRKRGRPPGSKNVKEPKAKPAAKPKAKVKAKPATPPPTDDEPLPQYVQQSLPPEPQDLAAQLFGLLQNHERQRADRRRATYASWMSRF